MLSTPTYKADQGLNELDQAPEKFRMKDSAKVKQEGRALPQGKEGYSGINPDLLPLIGLTTSCIK